MAQSNGPSNRALGEQVEEHVAKERGGERTPTAWFDVETDDGTLIEVKSTRVRLKGGRRGRYQLIEDNHENLLDHGGEYEFLLLDKNDSEVDRITVPASDIEDTIQEHDRKWPDGVTKFKLPWAFIHDMDDVPGEEAQ